MLESFRLARIAYFTHPRGENCVNNYCHCYFQLLHYVVHSKDLKLYSNSILRCLVGLETIPVYWQGGGHPDLIAVNTNTNPAYLLSRIRLPKSWHNLRFLPMITCRTFEQEGNSQIPLYHQYRQISGGTSRPTTLLTYIPATVADRKNSFIAWQHLAASLTRKKDTLIRTRAACLSEQVLRPTIAKIHGFEQSPEKILRIVDLGGGSGDLTKAMLENFLASNSESANSFRVSLTIVDHDFPDMRRHLKKTAFFRSLTSLKCQRKDFLDWLLNKMIPTDKPEIEVKVKMSEQQASKPFDFIFMFRLLNNMSEFGIGKTDSWEDARTITCDMLSEQDWYDGKHYPHQAISTNQIQNIVLSTTQISKDSQTTWCIASLTDYFQALYRLSPSEVTLDHCEYSTHNAIFFPFRKLNLDKILYETGRNLFEDLCRLCHFILIEDIDLRSNDLRKYLDRHNLSHIKVMDLPSKIPMSNTFCVFEEIPKS